MSENHQKRTLAPRTSRPKPAAAGNEEAGATLQLGEFQDVDTLTLSEASLVINALVAKRRADRRNVNETEWVLSFSRCGWRCDGDEEGKGGRDGGEVVVIGAWEGV